MPRYEIRTPHTADMQVVRINIRAVCTYLDAGWKLYDYIVGEYYTYYLLEQ